MGRPSTFTPALATRICDRIASGESIRSICSEKGMPGWETVRGWLLKHPEFAAQYARAREDQADAMDEEILETARSTTAENAQANRVKIDAYKWRAARLAPRKYGDRLAIDADVNVTMSGDEARARIAEIMQAAQARAKEA